MNKTMLTLIIGILSLPVNAADSYTVDSRHTFPSFEIDHMGFSTQRGRFNKTSGKLTLSPETGSGSIQITIDATSISTGLAELEDHLRSKDFFDATRYPQINFSSNQLKFDKDKLIAIDGNLSLHGETQPVHLSVDHFNCGINLISLKNTCGANATAVIKRSDFGMDKYVPAISDTVKVFIQFEATKD